MAQQTCMSCGGMGSQIGSRSVYDPSGGYMWKSVETRETCMACGGSGQTYVPDAPSGRGDRGHGVISADSGSRRPTTPIFPFIDRFYQKHFEGRRQVYIGLICGSIAGLAAFQFAKSGGATTAETTGLTIFAGLMGFSIVPLFFMAVKLALLVILVGVICLIAYGVFRAASTTEPASPATSDDPGPMLPTPPLLHEETNASSENSSR